MLKNTQYAYSNRLKVDSKFEQLFIISVNMDINMIEMKGISSPTFKKKIEIRPHFHQKIEFRPHFHHKCEFRPIPSKNV